jgi:hypothetical protein
MCFEFQRKKHPSVLWRAVIAQSVMWLGYGLHDWDLGVRFPAGTGNFSLHRVQTSSGAHPASCPTGIRGSLPGGKAAGAWSWPVASIQCRGQKMRGAIPSLSQHAFMARYSVKAQGQLYLQPFVFNHEPITCPEYYLWKPKCLGLHWGQIDPHCVAMKTQRIVTRIGERHCYSDTVRYSASSHLSTQHRAFPRFKHQTSNSVLHAYLSFSPVSLSLSLSDSSDACVISRQIN